MYLTKLAKSNSKLLLSIAVAFTSTCILASALTALSYFLVFDSSKMLVAGLLMFIACTFSSLRQLCYYKRETNKYLRQDRLINASIYFILGVMMIALYKYWEVYVWASLAFFLMHIAYNLLTLLRSRRPRHIVVVVLLSGICLLFFIVCATTWDPKGAALCMCLMAAIMAITSLLSIFAEAFSKLMFGPLKDIFQKTFAGEILLGLLFLIISFSIVFYVSEGISYGDALWYCFAIVTTIGFGDFVVHSLLCRVLSVILGIYGLIVVALITSIIVNFYNEMKQVTEKKEKDKEAVVKYEKKPVQRKRTTTKSAPSKPRVRRVVKKESEEENKE